MSDKYQGKKNNVNIEYLTYTDLYKFDLVNDKYPCINKNTNRKSFTFCFTWKDDNNKDIKIKKELK